MTTDEVKEIIYRELPAAIRGDAALRDFVLNAAKDQFAGKQETESRFDKLLEELRRDREENQRRWDENQRWWEENDRNLKDIIARFDRRVESTIGALGDRWGLQSESSFRNALKGILEESFAVQVVHFQDFDPEGKVFGRPDQIELDVIIRNGVLILCEIESSCTKAVLYAFWRKTTCYEERHGRTANRKLIISPMIDPAARKVAGELGIEVYGYPESVPVELS
jgi:hypothetical protein